MNSKSEATPALLDKLSGNAALLLALTTLFWAGNMTIGRWIAGQVPPITLAFLRWTGATLLIWPFAYPYFSREAATVRRHWLPILILGVTGSGLFNTFQYAALVHTSTTSAGVIYASGPMMIVLMSYVLNGERINMRQLCGIAVSFTGVLIVLAQGDVQALLRKGLNRGDFIMLVAVAIWAFYTAFLTRRPSLHPMTFALVTYAIAAMLNFPIAAAELAAGAVFHFTAATAAAILYTAVFPSLVAYLCYNRGVEIAGPARAGIYMNLVPLFAAALAMIFLGERPALYHAAGFLLILAGVGLVSKASRSAQ